MRSRRTMIVAGLLLIAVAAIGPRFGPRAGPTHSDPSLALEARATVTPPMAVLRRACFDCHSNDTRRPWYSLVAPVSWVVAHDILEGRAQLNFSQWAQYNAFDRADMLDKVCDMTTKRKMPMWQYRLLHADARLTDADVTAICAWADAEATRLVQGAP